MENQFAKDIIKGLKSRPKFLPSKYFYDKKGSEIFIEIMKMPEYYLTACEMEIFQKQSSKIIDAFKIEKGEKIEVIELGAGDGYKTIELLKELDKKHSFVYKPIDISIGALEQLEINVREKLPDLSIELIRGDFFQKLHELQQDNTKKIVLFLGSTLGNMEDEIATNFLVEIQKNLNKKDLLLIGLDLIKEERIVLPAYHDSQGITSSFNLNLLQRINRELHADFNLAKFQHEPEYSEKTGKAKSFLKSLEKQKIHFKDLDISIDFEKNERIFMEISRKYNDEILKNLLQKTTFQIKQKFLDSKQYFADYLLEVE
ncbi:L-histidine N(alpha)-methyltransferase [Aureivirga marina]|uniref:L-histidine N(alpha)-methyltransferase n=1 Tax=Aureivirga marina TaxID=1182451 RepID=UPI0018C93B99|nr:L-histidine N(alpha)-methyltransferase [Aureivirga marina]